ncbi:TNF receptor-associated factor 4, partial [Geodia barretti]
LFSPRFPLPPNFPLFNHIREKSKSRLMAATHYEFVGEVPLDILCGICLLVPHDPQRVTCCGRHFCHPCISEWMQVQCGQCPLCFRPNTSHHDDPSLAQRILLFHVYCTSRQKGCNWQGTLRDLEV